MEAELRDWLIDVLVGSTVDPMPFSHLTWQLCSSVEHSKPSRVRRVAQRWHTNSENLLATARQSDELRKLS